MSALAEQRLAFLPLAVGAPLGTPLGPSPCGRFVTIPLFRDWAIDLSARVQNAPRRDHGGGEITSHGEASK